MQKFLLLSKWIITCLCISLFLSLFACNNTKQTESEHPPELVDDPMTIQVNTKEGYSINQFYRDTVFTKTPINSFGDTIKTGSPYTIKGEIVSPDNIDFPKSVPAGKPNMRPAYTNIYPVSNVKVIPVIVDQLRNFVPDTFSERFILINSVGDTVPTGVPIPAIGKKVKCRFNSSQSAERMLRTTDAIHNILFLNTDQGLPFSDIIGIVEDKHSNLWIAMQQGIISRYDGKSLRIFGPESGLPKRFLSAILKDKKGNIWIGTSGGGLSRFDGEYFTTFTEENGLPNNFVRCITEDKKGNIWFGTGEGASCYTPSEDNNPGTFTHYSIKEGIKNKYINCIIEDRNENLWIGTTKNAITIFKRPHNGNPGRATYITPKEGLLGYNIRDIIEDKTGNIWIATEGGACRYDLSQDGHSGIITQYFFKEGISNYPVRKIFEDRSGNVWIGTIGDGVIKLMQKGFEGYPHLFAHFTKEEGLTSNIISSFIEDKSGNIWLGTLGGGVCCIKARSIRHLGEKEGLTDSHISSIYEDQGGNIWFGTIGDGLIKYQPPNNNRQGVYFQYTIEKGLPENYIYDITEDKNGNIWFGTSNSGLCRFDGTSFTTFTDRTGLTGNTISSILIDRSGNLWAGTGAAGICFLALDSYNQNSKPVFVRYTEKQGMLDNETRALYEDRKGNIWIGTMKGASQIKLSMTDHSLIATHFTEKEGLPGFIVNSFLEDQKGNFWIGVSGGLICYSSSNGNIPGTFTFHGIRYSSKANNMVRDLMEDHLGNIWYGTILGLGMVIRSEDSIRQNQRLYFSKSDGFKGKSFNINASVFDRNHLAWWGNTYGGVEVLDLNNFELTSNPPQPKLNGLNINERFIDFRNIPDSLKKGIEFDSIPPFENYPQGLNLSYKNNNVIFHYSAIDWGAPHTISYSFRMKGLNNTWSQRTEETKAEFRSLPYGKYTFEVCSWGEAKKWSKPFQYHFRIRPPWWFSWWAYTMYALVGCTVVYSSYQFQLSRKLALADKKRLVELDRVKNRLYTNITHEFRTPLTLIHGPVSNALTHRTNLDQKEIQSIYRQSERLQQLINQMLELQKLESGKLKPEYEYGEIIQIIRYLFNSFEPWARDKNISLIFTSPLQEVHMDLDQEKLTQIITNLVSNAIKHTPRSGKVALILNTSHGGDHLLIKVQDTGTGISAEDLPYIFDQFYQSKRAATGGTGIGLSLARNLAELLGGTLTVESTLDLGSTFTLSLPITRHAQKPLQALPEKNISISDERDEDIHFPTTDNQVPGKPIILIVEDHPEIAQYVASCFASEYQILNAFNGNDGVSMSYEHIPDLVISDVMMPGKDGFELTGILKNDIQTSHIPIILLTGRGDHEALLAGIEHGADAYVTKPFDPTELKLRVKKLLELRSNLSQYYRSHSTSEQPEVNVHTSAKENEFIKKLRSIIEDHINDSQFNMNMLSKHMAMSHPQLHRKITALTGESTGKFVRFVRLTKAKELLRNSELTISEIAYETGFSEPGYFTKIFAKEYNMTPSEFRGGLA